MLKLFQSIFGGSEKQEIYPESLIEMAIERAVDGTNRHFRVLSGYQKRLREPVIHAIAHAMALVDSLPQPLLASRRNYSEPRLSALFASPEHMYEVLGRDVLLRDFLETQKDGTATVTALLLAERKEKNVLGVELAGDMLRRDVAQVLVNFQHHRLVEVASSQEEALRQLKRRAFDYLISLALSRITEMMEERSGLNRQRELLMSKLRALKRSGWSFESDSGEGTDPVALQAELDDIETQFATLKLNDNILERQLAIVSEVLSGAETQFWAETHDLHLDRMNVLHDARDSSTPPICFHELHNGRGQSMTLLMLTLSPEELPPRQAFLANAERFI